MPHKHPLHHGSLVQVCEFVSYAIFIHLAKICGVSRISLLKKFESHGIHGHDHFLSLLRARVFALEMVLYNVNNLLFILNYPKVFPLSLIFLLPTDDHPRNTQVNTAIFADEATVWSNKAPELCSVMDRKIGGLLVVARPSSATSERARQAEPLGLFSRSSEDIAMQNFQLHQALGTWLTKSLFSSQH